MNEQKNLSEKNVAEEPEKEVCELEPEKLKDVTGAGDPFADVPRVPENPIDPELRENA